MSKSKPTLTERVGVLESTVAGLEAMLRERPVAPPAGAVDQARAAITGGEVPKPPRAQRDGLQRPTCVNFRRCGNKSEGVTLAEAIGWKCDPCKSGS